jgi:methylamine---glutamate N-methyltransferase subunit B
MYETHIYVRGTVAGLGADVIEKELREFHRAEVAGLLEQAGISGVDAGEFRRYGSGRNLYTFKIDNVY